MVQKNSLGGAEMIDFLYWSWRWVAGLSVIMSFASAISLFINRKRKDSNNREVKMLVSNVATALLTAGILVCFLSLYVSNTYVQVPALRDKTVGAAIQELQLSGLKVSLPDGVILNDDIMDRYVKNQWEDAGTIVEKGTSVTIYFSQDGVSYPKLSNDTDPETASIPDGYVIVPNVVDYEEENAVQLLESKGLEASVWYLSSLSDSFDKYYIIEQSIPEGSIVPYGTKVEIQRSGVKNGTSVVVPNVVGMEQEEATTTLTNAGLSFQVWWYEEMNDVSNATYIIQQSIPEGSTVPAGTVIRLQLGQKR